MISATIVGRLGGDPEVTYNQSGNAKATFSVASSRGRDQQGNDRTDWIFCEAFGKTAENIKQYFQKGSWISASGSMESYKAQQGGETRWTLVVRDWGFAGDAQQRQQPAQGAPQQAQPAAQAQAYPQPQYAPPAASPAPGPSKRVDPQGNEFEIVNGQEVQTVWMNAGVKHIVVNGQWVPAHHTTSAPPAYQPPPPSDIQNPFSGM